MMMMIQIQIWISSESFILSIYVYTIVWLLLHYKAFGDSEKKIFYFRFTNFVKKPKLSLEFINFIHFFSTKKINGPNWIFFFVWTFFTCFVELFHHTKKNAHPTNLTSCFHSIKWMNAKKKWMNFFFCFENWISYIQFLLKKKVFFFCIHLNCDSLFFPFSVVYILWHSKILILILII